MLEGLIGSDVLRIIRIVLDITTLSIVFYFLYKLFYTVRIPMLINQISIVLLIYIIASLLRLETVLWIFRNVFGWMIIGSLIIFHPELRALVMRVDLPRVFRSKKMYHTLPDLTKISRTIEYLRGIERGALLVFPRKVDLSHILLSTVELNAYLSEELLETIFSHNTILHDGAVIIKGNTVTHAGCIIPTVRGRRVVTNLGSRHRAALGLSNTSDAVILVLSEEFGSVSLVFDGEIMYDIGIEKSLAYLEQLLTHGKIDINILQLPNFITKQPSQQHSMKKGTKDG